MGWVPICWGGVSTTFIENLRFGRPSAKLAIVECDEGNLMDVAPIVKPIIILVTNISTESGRQIIRFPNHESTRGFIERSIRESKPKYVICPEDLHFENLGEDSEIVKYHITDSIKSVIPGQQNIKNAAAACTCLKLLGLESDITMNAVFNSPAPFGRFESIDIYGHNVQMMLSKNEGGITSAIDYLKTLDETFNLIFYLCEYFDSEGNVMPIKWMTDGNVLEFLKNNNCDVFVGGSYSGILSEYFFSNGFQLSKLESASDIVPFVRTSNKKTIIIYNMKGMWEVFQYIPPIRI